MKNDGSSLRGSFVVVVTLLLSLFIACAEQRSDENGASKRQSETKQSESKPDQQSDKTATNSEADRDNKDDRVSENNRDNEADSGKESVRDSEKDRELQRASERERQDRPYNEEADLNDRDRESTNAATMKNINANPGQYIGKTVTLEGEVEELLSNRAFILDGDGIIGDEILVVSRKRLPMITRGGNRIRIGDRDNLIVTGVVQRFVAAEIERDLGFELDQGLEMEFEGKNVLIVDRIESLSNYKTGY